MNIGKIKEWIVKNYQDKNEAEVNDLIWLDKKLTNKDKLNWSLVDTVDFDIESIPKRKELVIEFKANPKEVEKWQKNLLK